MASADDLLDIVAQTPDPVSSLMYIGHNPAAAQLAYDLTGAGAALPHGGHRGDRAAAGRGPAWPPDQGDLVAHWTPKTGAQ